MILEALLEQKIVEQLSAMPELSAAQIIGSRLETKTESAEPNTVIAVATGFRQHDSFSLTPITLPIAITVVTRVEGDSRSVSHNAIVEAVTDKLSYWHKYGDQMTDVLSTEKCTAFELKIDGGSSQKYDRATSTWSDSVNITIRGSEHFNG